MGARWRCCGLSSARDLITEDATQHANAPAGAARLVFKRKVTASFLGYSDWVILKTTIVLSDKIVVSTDSDFWDPAHPGDHNYIGKPNAAPSTKRQILKCRCPMVIWCLEERRLQNLNRRTLGLCRSVHNLVGGNSAGRG